MPGFVGVLERPQIDLGGPAPEFGEQASQEMRLAVAAVRRNDELRLRGTHWRSARRRTAFEFGEFAQEIIQRCIIETVYRE